MNEEEKIEKSQEKDELKEFEENPFNPDKSRPEDVMRIFFVENIPIIPVVSKIGTLLGILKREDVVSELSDIERVKNQKIDQFITKLLKKVTLDDLLVYVSNTKEFTVINIFGNSMGKWPRLDLLEASERFTKKQKSSDAEMERQKEEQILEWMIYLILEHIPRALYAINQDGKTIFFNSHFEELCLSGEEKEPDMKHIEDSLGNPDKNDFLYKKNNTEEIFFYNKELDFYYEKIPMISDGNKVGFLIFCDKDVSEITGTSFPWTSFKGKSLEDTMNAIERMILVDVLKEKGNDLKAASAELKISKPSLSNKLKKFDIKLA